MTPEDIKQAVKLFDTPEKWNAFVELAPQLDSLRRTMHETAYVLLKSHCWKQPDPAYWSYKPLGGDHQEMMWYLTRHGEYSICLMFGWQGHFWLDARGGEAYHHLDKAAELLQLDRYKPLLAGFGPIDEILNDSCLATEKINFLFGAPDEPISELTETSLAWHAQFETERYIKQAMVKVARFQTPEMTRLLDELNEQTRRQPVLAALGV